MIKEPIKDNSQKHNSIIYSSMTFIITIGMTFCMDGYIQSYLLKLGAGSQGVGVYGFIVQSVALITFLAASTISPLSKNFMIKYILSAFGVAILPVGLVISIFLKNFLFIALFIILITGGIQSACISYKSTAEYSLMPYLFERKDYVRLYSCAAIAGGIVSAIITYLFENIVKTDTFSNGYMHLFFLAVIFIVIGAIFSIFYRPEFKQIDYINSNSISYKEIFIKLSSGRYNSSLFPHILRGVGMAAIYFIIPVSMRNIALTEQQMTQYVLICVLNGIAGNAIFLYITSRIRTGTITFAANAICSICLILLSINKSDVLFFILIGVFQCFNIISQLSIPAGVLKSTSNEDLPFITSLRLFLLSAVSSLCILLFGWLFTIILPLIVMSFCGLIYSFCGFLYLIEFKDNIF